MMEHTEEQNTSVSQYDIEDLKAIYEDYLYMARQHELIFARETIDELSFRQVQHMYPECKDPRKFYIPWAIFKLNVDERQEFADYIANNIPGDGHKTYVSIQHIKAKDNNGRGPVFAIAPYQNMGITMQLPSMMESYTISYPKSVTLKDTEFYIDGRYKAIYFGSEEMGNKLLTDCIYDPKLLTEITIMLNLGECSRQNNYKDDNKFGRMAVNVYAAEVLNTNENNLLEVLGTFADKVRKICHARYHEENSEDDIKRAQKEGFLNLPDNFQDYLNIRDFVRHQWDTLDDLDDFSLEQSRENKRIRAKRINSFLKFYDKSLYQRMLACIDILHQMQQIIMSVDSLRIVRNIGESNNKFIERIKNTCRQNPHQQFDVELNYPLDNTKYEALKKILHKTKIFSNIRIVDDLMDDKDKIVLMMDYEERSLFLRNLHDMTCYALGHCQRRGVDKNSRNVWSYLQNIKLITPEECQTMQNYVDFRNNLAHKHFDIDLRMQLYDVKDKYPQDFQAIIQKVWEAGPDVTKKDDNTFEYTHIDGAVATVNYESHDRKTTKKGKNKKTKTAAKCQKEAYPNGVEIKIEGKKVIGIKLPNQVYVNLTNKSIIFGNNTRWYSNAQNFNALQTETHTIRTDKELKITGLFEGNHEIPLPNENNLLLDDNHSILLDDSGRIKNFNFTNAKDEIITTKFKPSANEHCIISFADGTNILLSAQEAKVIRHTMVLNYDNRREFALTYAKTPLFQPQIIKPANSR